MLVIFRFIIEDEKILEFLEDISKDKSKSGKFAFGLRSAINSPTSAYRFHFKNETFKGFEIIKRIFPFHEGFSIKDLDDAIQEVVSAGVMGQSFLLVFIGEKELEQRIIEETKTEPPDGMYF